MRKFDVIAIGELNVDLIVTGLQSMPVVGREIIAADSALVLGSSTAITASGLSRLGLATGFLGKLGRDRFAEVVIEALNKNGIDTSHVIFDEAVQTGLTISLSTSKDRALVTHLGSIEALALADFDLSVLDLTRHIHVGSYFLQHRLRPDLADIFREAERRGVTTSLDVGWDDTNQWDYGIMDVLKYTDIFLPNETEALHITGKQTVQEALDELSRCSKNVVAIKCGSDGAIARQGDERAGLKGLEVEPVDTTGAGDSFNAGFIYGFLNQFSLAGCLAFGNACGSISVTRIGGASSCADLAEATQMAERYSSGSNGGIQV